MSNQDPSAKQFLYPKEDNRPALRGWCPGEYTCTCLRCKEGFIGDKRSYVCADCEYAYGDNNTMSPEASIAITNLSRNVHKDNVEKGFYDTPKEEVDRLSAFVANAHGETSELWESVRKGTLREPCDKNCGLTNMEEEMADIIIRVLDTAGFFGLDIGEAIRKKLEYNRTRPQRHGGKLA